MLRIHNPHSALAALEARPKDVTELVLPTGGGLGRNLGEGWEKVIALAKKEGVRVTTASPKPRTERGGVPVDGGRTSAAELVVNEREPLSVEELFSGARDRAQGKGLWLALDCLQDPHNVGAIFRTAAFFGVQGVLLTQERSAPLSSAVYDVASGGMESVPFAVEVNLQRSFEKAKDAGLWILGSSEHGKDDYSKIERDRPWLLVIGNEEKGMRRLTEESCDVLCGITPRGEVRSLNASVAAAILISHFS